MGSVSAASSIATARTRASSVAASSVAVSKSSVSQSISKETKSTESVSVAKKMDLVSEQAKSIDYGRRSMSKAVRRAEIHAANSGKDPRHLPVPRNVSDDICKVVADLHISPYDGKEVSGAKAAYQQGRLKVDRLEKELGKVTESAMSYKSLYAKSASQMAAEAYSAMEAEAKSSKKTRKTIVESSSKRVAAA